MSNYKGEQSKAISISEVKKDINYALVITTNG